VPEGQATSSGSAGVKNVTTVPRFSTRKPWRSANRSMDGEGGTGLQPRVWARAQKAQDRDDYQHNLHGRHVASSWPPLKLPPASTVNGSRCEAA
jgi:hypothetical protein